MDCKLSVFSRLLLPLLTLGLGGSACNTDDDGGSPFGTGANDEIGEEGSSGGEQGDQGEDSDQGDQGEDSSEDDQGSEGTLFDIGSGEEDTTGGGCRSIPHTPCDANTDDPFAAMGLGCPGEFPVTTTIDAHPDGLGVLQGFGSNDTFDPTEGSAFVVLSTGHVAELGDEPASPGQQIFNCNKWFTPGDGMNTATFPDPIEAQDVGGDCLANPQLVGMGDCSNTIEDQFSMSGFKYDYQELRVSLTVPEDAVALGFDVAYLTTEWPVFAGQPYNDMFIAWLEAPNWTGNVSFDQNGNALSLNSAFLALQDSDGTLPEFAGTCLRYGAGTPWLSSTVDVNPGDAIELVFAVFDLDDVNLDSMVFLDNFHWECEGGGGPSTVPIP